MRQIHHWAALLFLVSIVVHLMRVFFTGAFRKPREINWLIGIGLLTLGLLEGFAGYSLPDDLLSGTGLRIGYSILESIPVVGTWLAFFVWGGEFPGHGFLSRLYTIHILLPGLILALVTVHLLIIWYQKHTQFPGQGKTETNVVGSKLFPTYAAKGGGFFFLVFAVIALLGALVQINPIWYWGPYDPAQVSRRHPAGLLPRHARRRPASDARLGDPSLGHQFTIPFNLLFPGVILPGIMFTLLGAVALDRKAIRHPRLRPPPPARPATGQPGTHRRRHDGAGLLRRPALRGRQRHHRQDLPHLALHHDLRVPLGTADRRSAGRLLGDQADLLRPAPAGGRGARSRVSRPAPSSGCRTASSSRCTASSPSAAGPSSTRTRNRLRRRRPRCRSRDDGPPSALVGAAGWPTSSSPVRSLSP